MKPKIIKKLLQQPFDEMQADMEEAKKLADKEICEVYRKAIIYLKQCEDLIDSMIKEIK